LGPALSGVQTWNAATLEAVVRTAAESAGIKLGALAQPLRAGLTGSTASPSIFEVMQVLGRTETLGRLSDATSPAGPG
jgi:glutamyl-tRNA synthetase